MPGRPPRVKAAPREAIELAPQFGFEAVEPSADFLGQLSEDALAELGQVADAIDAAQVDRACANQHRHSRIAEVDDADAAPPGIQGRLHQCVPHLPFHIGPLERDRWLVHMAAAVDTVCAERGEPSEVREEVRREILRYLETLRR